MTTTPKPELLPETTDESYRLAADIIGACDNDGSIHECAVIAQEYLNRAATVTQSDEGLREARRLIAYTRNHQENKAICQSCIDNLNRAIAILDGLSAAPQPAPNERLDEAIEEAERWKSVCPSDLALLVQAAKTHRAKGGINND